MAFFKRSKPSGPASTGHPGDDGLLRQIASRSDLSAPRHWVHYLYCADESAARGAAAEAERAGWQLQRVDAAATGTGWVVVAERHDAVTSPEQVRAARAFFEDLASRTDGGGYDGWEASV